MFKFKSIELFAGAGGLAIGLENANFRHIALNELDKFAVQTLRLNRPKWNVFDCDIQDLVKKNLTDLFKIKYSELDLLSGGVPCQAFSYAGNRLGFEDSRGTMFFFYLEFVKQLKPKIVLIENVKGLLTHDNGKTFQTIKYLLENEGYKIYYKVLNAWDYDVPQKRERLFIIGTRLDLKGEFKFPNKSSYKPILRDALKDVPYSDGVKYSKKKEYVLNMVKPGGCWIDLPKKVAMDYMGKSFYSKGGKRGVARRISWDEPSLTLTCSPNQTQTERCHPDETRPFTVREYARIQTFPDDWSFCGSIYNQYKQIGNAVPVNLGYAIGKSISEFLNYNAKKEENLMKKRYDLDFIKYDDLKEHINKTVIETYFRSFQNFDLKKLNSNTVDPFKFIFDTKIYKKDLKTWISDEIIRQKDKTNNNSIGYFHQNIFRYIKNCSVPEKGFDVIYTGSDYTYYVELKNKYNTMNSSSSQKTYIKFQNWLRQNADKKYKCALVEVISRKSINKPWEITCDSNKLCDKDILRISIDQFYDIVTNEKDAFYKLCMTIPKIIDDILEEKKCDLNGDMSMDNLIRELHNIDSDSFNAILKLAFGSYLGFDELKK